MCANSLRFYPTIPINITQTPSKPEGPRWVARCGLVLWYVYNVNSTFDIPLKTSGATTSVLPIETPCGYLVYTLDCAYHLGI